MPAEFLGEVSIGGEIPPVAAVLEEFGNLIQNVRDELARQIAALEAAKIAIRIPAVFDLQVQLDAALDFQANIGLQISDPFAFIQQILEGIAQVQSAIQNIGPPDIALQAELSASLEIALGLSLKIGFIDLQLSLLDAIAEILEFLRGTLLPALDAYAALARTLAVTGAYSFSYAGPLSSLGSDLSFATPLTGIDPATGVVAVVLLAPDTQVAAQAAMRATFKFG